MGTRKFTANIMRRQRSYPIKISPAKVSKEMDLKKINIPIIKKPETPPKVKTVSSNIDPGNVVKQLNNGHSLVLLKRNRVKGFCVECIKKNPSPTFKNSMPKIFTYCPKCPGGNWICEDCFDEKHKDL